MIESIQIAIDMKSPDEFEREELEKRYAKLSTTYELLREQIEGELNADNQQALQTRRETIQQQMREVWSRLEELKRSSRDRIQQYRTFREDLPKIDFDEVMDDIKALTQTLRRGGDALLLLQESLSMSGDLCLQRIRDEFKQSTGNFKPYKVGLYFGDALNEYGWLDNLGGYFGLVDSKPEKLAKLVIEQICSSVKIGSTVFLEIHNWDDLPCQEKTLFWFMQHFWMPLIQCLKDQEKYPRVKFIAVIVVDAELSPECFSKQCLCEMETTPFRWLKLPLRNWTQDEIQEWLELYPGIGNPRSINLSQRFFNASRKGIPSMVRQALEKELLLTQA